MRIMYPYGGNAKEPIEPSTPFKEDDKEKGKTFLRKSIKQLIKIGLIKEERQGTNKPNRIYLTVINIKNEECENMKKDKKATKMKCKKFSPNYTNINDTEYKSIS